MRKERHLVYPRRGKYLTPVIVRCSVVEPFVPWILEGRVLVVSHPCSVGSGVIRLNIFEGLAPGIGGVQSEISRLPYQSRLQAVVIGNAAIVGAADGSVTGIGRIVQRRDRADVKARIVEYVVAAGPL